MLLNPTRHFLYLEYPLLQFFFLHLFFLLSLYFVFQSIFQRRTGNPRPIISSADKCSDFNFARGSESQFETRFTQPFGFARRTSCWLRARSASYQYQILICIPIIIGTTKTKLCTSKAKVSTHVLPFSFASSFFIF